MTTAAVSSVDPGSATADSSRRIALLVAVVLSLTFLVYCGTMTFEFVYDDGAQIVYNSAVQSWKHLPRLFSEHVWSAQSGVVPNYYRPAFMTWCLVQYEAFGLKPAGWHLAGVFLHLIATWLVFALARRLLADDLAAVIAALLFGLHPIHVETVAWISGTTDSLLAIFFLGSLLSYLRFREAGKHRWAWLGASLVQYALACLSKEPGIVLPALIAVYEWLYWDPAHPVTRLRRATESLVPFIAVAALYLAQRQRVLQGLGHTVVTLPLKMMPLSWPKVLWFYVEKLFWPVQLSPFYDTHYVVTANPREFWLPLCGIVALAAALWFWFRGLPESDSPQPNTRSAAWFSLALLLLPLLPVLDIVSLEPREIAHDRYLYLPSVGFVMLLAMLIRRLNVGSRQVWSLPAAQVALMIVLTCGMAYATLNQSLYWANDLLLYEHAARVSPTSISAANNLANVLLERKFYDEGIRIHEQILKSDPTFWQSHFNLGNAYYKLGKYDQAEEHLARAAQLNSSSPQTIAYLAIAQMKNHHLDLAEQNMRLAIRIWPKVPGGHTVLGMVLEQEGKWADAAQAYRDELAIDSDQPKVRQSLAEAEKHLSK